MRCTAVFALVIASTTAEDTSGDDVTFRPGFCVGARAPPGRNEFPPHQMPQCRPSKPDPPEMNATAPEQLMKLLPSFEEQRLRLGLNVSKRSRCTLTSSRASCPYKEVTVGGRPVFYQVPEGTAPSGGWPVMVYYHAWYAGGANDWSADYPTQPNRDGGVYWEVATKKALLDMGVAWISPDATRNGNACPANRNCWWQTNENPYKSSDLSKWDDSRDHKFILEMFDGIQKGTFGDLNINKMHTGGFSSGAFMAARMPFNYASYGWKSMFNVAGSLYYCCGCGLQYCQESWLDEPQLADLMKTHTPTLFIHGAADTCVTPLESAMYNRRLEAAGVATKYVSPRGERHHWVAESAEEVSAWVQRYG